MSKRDIPLRSATPELLKAEELADLLGVKVATIRAWTRERRIPFIRVGKKLIRFSLPEINDWLRRSTTGPLLMLREGTPEYEIAELRRQDALGSGDARRAGQ